MFSVHFISLRLTHFNQDKSAAEFFCQVAAWVRDMLCNFYLVKGHKIANDSTTTEAREKNKHSFEIHKIFVVCLTKAVFTLAIFSKISCAISQALSHLVYLPWPI